MNTSRIATLGLGALCIAFSLGANAGGQMTDSSHITNGGTGYIGLTESAGQPRTMNTERTGGLPAGEASTLVNGQPNVEPNAPAMMAGWNHGATRTMGAPRAMSESKPMAAGMHHPLWGTPD